MWIRPRPWLLLAALLLGRVAWAHPESADAWGHQLEIALRPDRVEVELTVEVPIRRAAMELSDYLRGRPEPGPEDQAAFDAAFRAELADNLRVELSGVALACAPLPATATGSSDPRFVVWRLHLACPLNGESGALRVVHGAWPDERAVYRVLLWVDDGVRLEASSLVDRRGERTRNRDGLWLPDPTLREPDFHFSRRAAPAAVVAGAWRYLVTPPVGYSPLAPEVEVLGGEGPQLRALARAGGHPGVAWRAGLASALLALGGALGGGTGLGLLALGPADPRRRAGRVGLVALGALLGALLSLLPTLPALVLNGLCVFIFAVMARLMDRPGLLPGLLAFLGAGLAPLSALRAAMPVAASVGDGLTVAIFAGGAALGAGLAALLLAALSPRIPVGLRRLLLLLGAVMHAALALGLLSGI